MFRSPLSQTAWLSHSRRLADSNRCINPLAVEAQSQKRLGSLSLADFVTGTPAALTAEETSPIREVTHPLASHHLGGARVRRPNCTFGHLADLARGPSLASAALVVASGVLHSPVRVGGLASRRDRLDGRQVAVFRGDAVSRQHLAVSRGCRSAFRVVAARAALPRLSGVVA